MQHLKILQLGHTVQRTKVTCVTIKLRIQVALKPFAVLKLILLTIQASQTLLMSKSQSSRRNGQMRKRVLMRQVEVSVELKTRQSSLELVRLQELNILIRVVPHLLQSQL